MRSAVRNKVILEIFSERDKKTVACHVAFWTPLNVHIGLVLVDKVAQGRGLQQVSRIRRILSPGHATGTVPGRAQTAR